MTPASPTSERPGSTMISGRWLPKCRVSASVTACAVALDRGDLAAIVRREAAADIDHAQVDVGPRRGRRTSAPPGRSPCPIARDRSAASRHGTRRHRGRAPSCGPCAAGPRPSPGRSRTCASGHSAPSQSTRMRQNTRAPGARAGELLQLGLAVEGEEAHALLVGKGDVLFLLDGVAEGDAVLPTPVACTSRSRRGLPRRTSSRGPTGATGSRAAGLAFTA